MIDRHALVTELRRQADADAEDMAFTTWRRAFRSLADSLDGTDWLADDGSEVARLTAERDAARAECMGLYVAARDEVTERTAERDEARAEVARQHEAVEALIEEWGMTVPVTRLRAALQGAESPCPACGTDHLGLKPIPVPKEMHDMHPDVAWGDDLRAWQCGRAL